MRAPVSPPSTSTTTSEPGIAPAPALGPVPPRAAGLPRLSDHQRRWLDDVAFVELEERSRIDQETSDLRRRRARAYELRAVKTRAAAG